MLVSRPIARALMRLIGGVAGLVRDELAAVADAPDGSVAARTGAEVGAKTADAIAKRARVVERRVAPSRRR